MRKSHVALLMAVLILGIARGVAPATAGAAWGREGHLECEQTDEPINRHCYVIVEHESNSPLVGLSCNVYTSFMDMYGWETGDYGTNECWFFPENEQGGYVEVGQVAGDYQNIAGANAVQGDCCSMHPFSAVHTPAGNEHVDIGPGVVSEYSTATYQHYAITDYDHSGVWRTTWGCCGEQARYGGGLGTYAESLQAGLELAANTKPEATGQVHPYILPAGGQWGPVPSEGTSYHNQANCISHGEDPGTIGWYPCEKPNSAAPAQSPATNETERVTNYSQPTGAEASVAAAISRAAEYARKEVPSGKLRLRVVHSTFGQAQGVLDRESAVGSPSAEVREWDGSTAYAISVEGRGQLFYQLAALIPPGYTRSRGKVLSLIIDAHTDVLEHVSITRKPPLLHTLGPVTKTILR
jgi:hypothetical protein